MSYVSFALPDVGEPEEIKVDVTPDRVNRGSYLANSVSACMDCHSTRDWSRFAGPIVPGTLGKGGEEFNQDMGFPGKFYAPNITPFALASWTDGEILRAITSGVSKEGTALFPVMPHPNFGKMDREDLYSIIAYLRTLKPIKNELRRSEPDFPMNFIINTIPQKPAFTKIPDEKDVIQYGAYLFNAASCGDCHTQKDTGSPVPGMELAGGFEFVMPGGSIVRSSNITPDEQTGLGNWDTEVFLNKFRQFRNAEAHPVKPGEFNSPMPWALYSTMKDEDLKAIFSYLKTIRPVRNEVVRFTASR